eukprot:6210513-Pleurochrysis_carterae.AAC.2
MEVYEHGAPQAPPRVAAKRVRRSLASRASVLASGTPPVPERGVRERLSSGSRVFNVAMWRVHARRCAREVHIHCDAAPFVCGCPRACIV